MPAVTHIDADLHTHDRFVRRQLIYLALLPLALGCLGLTMLVLRPQAHPVWVGGISTVLMIIGIGLLLWKPNRHRRQATVLSRVEIGEDKIEWRKGEQVLKRWPKDNGDVVRLRTRAQRLEVGANVLAMLDADLEQFDIEALRAAVIAHGWAWQIDNGQPVRQD